MKHISHRAGLVAMLATTGVLVLAGCGSDTSQTTSTDHSGSSAARGQAQSAQFNDADVMFAQMMVAHHEQALTMAKLASTRAANPQVKELAGQMHQVQGGQRTMMHDMLTAWGKPTTAPAGGHGGHGGMPGMMSEADMASLMAAQGGDFDRIFLRMMIAHHNGAVQMAREETSGGVNPKAKELAAQVEQQQSAEVQKLQELLDRA